MVSDRRFQYVIIFMFLSSLRVTIITHCATSCPIFVHLIINVSISFHGSVYCQCISDI